MDDLISRQAAIEALEKFEKQCWEDMCFRPLMSDARVIIKGLPSAQPEQKTGRWIHDEEHQGDIHCSLCDEIIVVDDESWANAYFRFCPYCGARMEK